MFLKASSSSGPIRSDSPRSRLPKKNLKKVCSQTGVADGIFLDQKSQFGKILKGQAMEEVGIF
jgi:hypothetical protein